MSVPKIEALADGIGMLNQYNDPSSESYQTRNSGLLRAYTLRTLANTTKDMVRVFGAHQGGYRALLCELDRKCKGETRAKGLGEKPLTSASKLADLLITFGIRHSLRYNQPTKQLIDFLRVALKDDSIDEDTPLLYFVN